MAKREPYHRADHGHHLRAVVDAREIRGERHHHRRDCAGTLQRAPGDRRPDVGCRRGQQASGGEDREAHIDHGLSAPAVGGHAERNLKNGLRKAIGAERDADEREVVAAGKLRRMHGEHRKDEKQAEHAQPEHAGKARPGAQLGRAHAFRGHGCVGGKVKRAIVTSFS
jgi:hypothetical protein